MKKPLLATIVILATITMTLSAINITHTSNITTLSDKAPCGGKCGEGKCASGKCGAGKCNSGK